MYVAWVWWILAVACAAVAGYYATALITHGLSPQADAGGRRGGYELSHLAMALGMAAMFSPLGDPVPGLVWLIVFGTAAVWFTVRLLRAGTAADDAAHHHLVANLAMLFMVVGGHRQHDTGTTAGEPVSAGHEGHTTVAGGGLIEGPISTVLIVVFAGYFAVHIVRSLRVLFSAAPQAKPTPQAPVVAGIGPVAAVVTRSGTERAQAACQVVMGSAMVVMFGLMV
jgi:uncharacterized protein DUF5134